MAKITLADINKNGLGFVAPEKLRAPVSEADVSHWAFEDDAASEAEAISDLRKKFGLSQEEFSKLLGIPVSTWRKWEQGQRRPSPATRALFRILWREPEATLRALKEDQAA